MPPETYRFLHVFGALLLFLGLGGVFTTGARQGDKPSTLYLALHGIGLLLMLIAGIGFAHKSGLGWPGWMIAKIGCWVLIAAMPVLLRRGILPRTAVLVITLGLGAAAIWLVQTKPF
jgi:hypothetical protein